MGSPDDAQTAPPKPFSALHASRKRHSKLGVTIPWHLARRLESELDAG
jgi:hypothetical protein